MSEFKIALLSAGDNPNNWDALASILDGPEPDWSYRPYQEAVMLGNGQKRGMGFPSATWTWRGISETDRETLRGYCSGLSAEVYVATPTNETTSGARDWINASAIMQWMDEDEEKNVNHTLDFQVEFTAITEVT